eukprot:Skav219354  [mRNA]  locus=scaffold76:477123:481309:- [translate_table: standard]
MRVARSEAKDMPCGCCVPKPVAVEFLEEGSHSGVCFQKSASALRSFAPWQSWIQTIRDYGNSAETFLRGKAEALILAQAMEDNGCDFLTNLSEQNISLGGCFAWSNNFDWKFKTLEVFCPRTCDCDWQNSEGSGCPRPFGMTCAGEEIYGCLSLNEQHYCLGYNAEQFEATIGFGVSPLACPGWRALGSFLKIHQVISPLGGLLSAHRSIALPRLEYLHEIELSARGAIASKLSVGSTVDPETVVVEPWR